MLDGILASNRKLEVVTEEVEVPFSSKTVSTTVV